MSKKTTYYNGIEAQVKPFIRFEDIFQKYAAVAEIFTLSQWETLVLRYQEGLANKDIGKLLGINPRSVRSRLHRAKERLASHQRELRAEHFRLIRTDVDRDNPLDAMAG